MAGLRERFRAWAAKTPPGQRQEFPSPEALYEKGIKTRAVLDWLERRAPEPPKLALTPEDHAARQQAAYENGRFARSMRRRFLRRGVKTRMEFQKARDGRPNDRHDGMEQER